MEFPQFQEVTKDYTLEMDIILSKFYHQPGC